MSSGPSPVPGLVAAVLVLVAGVAAIAVHDDGPPSVAPTTTTTTTTTSLSPRTSTTTSTAPNSTGTTTSPVATTVKPAVGSPEAAANGLWASYAASNRLAAQRFASDDVVRVLFEEPYDGEPGTFVGCRPHDGIFDCRYTQPSTEYAMTVTVDAAGSFKVVELTVSPST